jgi:nucleotide-binding universal stress UspA family protein
VFRTIVVGSDGSETAGEAVAKAIELARVCGARLLVVSAFKPSDVALVMGSAADAALAAVPTDTEVRDALGRLVDEQIARCDATGVECETHVVAGSPAQVLLEIATQEHADLIVVGNRGMSGVRHLLGSVPNTVTHHAPCSVLVIATS